MVDKVTQANKRIAAQSAKAAKGPVAKMQVSLSYLHLLKGLTPTMLIDLAKSKGIITKEQQADFKRRVGKDTHSTWLNLMRKVSDKSLMNRTQAYTKDRITNRVFKHHKVQHQCNSR